MQPSFDNGKPTSHRGQDDDEDFFEFGKPSTLRSPLASKTLYNPMKGPPAFKKAPNVFIDRRKEKPSFQQPRNVSGGSTGSMDFASFDRPTSDAAIEKLQAELKQGPRTNIYVPRGPPTFTTQAATQPIFNSVKQPPLPKPTQPIFNSVKQPPLSKPTQKDEEHFNPDAEIEADQTFGAADPHMYLDSERAAQNMKNLLEGAFDVEKPKIRLKRLAAKKDSTKSLVDKLASLTVETEPEVDEEDDGTVEGMVIKLLPHQVEGVAWMIDRESGKPKKGIVPHGGILADDMGLGKTVQSVALILLNPRPPLDAVKENSKQKLPGKATGKGTLVVAPLALIKQWESEIQSKVAKTHTLKVLVHHGTNRTKSAEQLKKYDVVITTYQILTSEYAASDLERPGGARIGCFGVDWWRVMLDEAHSIKNRSAKSTIACCALTSYSRWCLTGTPMQNNLDELQSLLKFLRTKPYCELADWKSHITQPMKAGRGGLAMKRLQLYLQVVMKRRTKDILKKEGALTFGGKDKPGEQQSMQIVQREIISIVCHFDEQEQAFYTKLADRAQQKINDMFGAGKQDYIGALVLLLRLRQACNHPALIEAAITKDSDALNIGVTPKKAVDDMDGLTALMGGVTVESRVCDVCQFDLTTEQARAGKTRCDICDSNIASVKVRQPKSRSKARRVIDSDDEDDDGEQEDPVTPESSEDDLAGMKSPALSHLKPFQGSKHQPSTKIRHILSILHSETPNHKIIVFSQFTSMLDIIQPHIKQRYVRYDGSMRPDDREASLRSLRNDPRTRVLLCSLKCGSLGLNLTAASRVIIVEPFWNPFVEEQAIDRVHRLNQTVDVKVYRLTVADTVEERILALQERKRKLAAKAIEGAKGEKASDKLGVNEIRALFGHGAQNAQFDEADREFHNDFGSDSKLIDGPSLGKSAIATEMNDMRQKGKARAMEHEIYGRRW